MRCISTYPMKIEDTNLVTINAKKDIITKLAIVVIKWIGNFTIAAAGLRISSLEETYYNR